MRDGILSDDSIKYAFPEYQPMNMGVHDAMEPVVFEKHGFTGIKLPKTYKYKRNPRFPIYDFTNFANLAAGDDKKRVLYDATRIYRDKISKMKPAGTPVPFMSVNLAMNRNKQSINQINKQLRGSTIGLTQVETRINNNITDNLVSAQRNVDKAAKAAIRQERIDQEFRNSIYFGEAYNKQTEQHKNKELRGMISMPMTSVDLESSFRAGSATNVISTTSIPY